MKNYGLFARSFLIISGLSAIAMLMAGKPRGLGGIALYAIISGLILSAIYFSIRKPLLHICRWYFDKNYKYHVIEKRKSK